MAVRTGPRGKVAEELGCGDPRRAWRDGVAARSVALLALGDRPCGHGLRFGRLAGLVHDRLADAGIHDADAFDRLAAFAGGRALAALGGLGLAFLVDDLGDGLGARNGADLVEVRRLRQLAGEP